MWVSIDGVNWGTEYATVIGTNTTQAAQISLNSEVIGTNNVIIDDLRGSTNDIDY